MQAAYDHARREAAELVARLRAQNADVREWHESMIVDALAMAWLSGADAAAPQKGQFF